MNLVVISLGLFAAVALTVAAVLLLLRDLGRRRAANVRDSSAAEFGELELLPVGAADGAQDASWLGRLVTDAKSDFTSETAVLLAVLLGLTLGGALFLWRDDWLAAAVGAAIGMFGVGGLLMTLRYRRFMAIREQLPDVMEMMARCVRAGQSLDQAIVTAANSTLRAVAPEFRYCAGQMEIGLSLESAMRGLVHRLPLAETRILAMILIVQRRRGGSLPTALERLARVFRDRLNFRRQFWSSTAAGRGGAVLIALLALALDAFIIIGHPEYAKILSDSELGRGLLVAAVALQVIGISWAVWLFRSDY